MVCWAQNTSWFVLGRTVEPSGCVQPVDNTPHLAYCAPHYTITHTHLPLIALRTPPPPPPPPPTTPCAGAACLPAPHRAACPASSWFGTVVDGNHRDLRPHLYAVTRCTNNRYYALPWTYSWDVVPAVRPPAPTTYPHTLPPTFCHYATHTVHIPHTARTPPTPAPPRHPAHPCWTLYYW